MNYKSEKTTKMIRLLDEMRTLDSDVLADVADIIQLMVEFYDHALACWDNPGAKGDGTEYTPEEVTLGKKCCHAGLNMAEGIVNELRIHFLEPAMGIGQGDGCGSRAERR